MVPLSGSKFGTNEVWDAVRNVRPPPPLVLDPLRVVAQRRRRVGVSKLGAHVGDRRVGGQQQTRVGVPQVVEPEFRECRGLEGALESFPARNSSIDLPSSFAKSH